MSDSDLPRGQQARQPVPPSRPNSLFDPVTGALRRDRNHLFPRADYASATTDPELGSAVMGKFSRQLERVSTYVALPIAVLQLLLLPGLFRQGLGFVIGGLILIVLADLYAVAITLNAATKGLLDDIGFFPRNRLFLVSWCVSCLVLSPLFWRKPEFMTALATACFGLCGAMIVWQMLAPFVLAWYFLQWDGEGRPLTNNERFACHRYLLDRDSLGYGTEGGLPEIARCAAAVLIARFSHFAFLFVTSLGLGTFAQAGAASLAVMATPLVWLVASALDLAARGREERPEYVVPDSDDLR